MLLYHHSWIIAMLHFLV
uniref:Uncharacterized protein n=1 Tax=Anguilla anguilla TaxID=7936 RepID=A0A0E9W0S2_ANGAN